MKHYLFRILCLDDNFATVHIHANSYEEAVEQLNEVYTLKKDYYLLDETDE